ncbi:hypothetical protein KFL_002560070 [Klebsormidium nitens]|uniref:Hexosyltransferase n=1 Tax=Klebsormidium nitens TaxID=105231 RepID=A0A0U9HK45_KLENI|nr:hypothetical protein KFL_002560070 [Klebsormidium nitens]|eukprot:GAQ85822.1 hypothetical protein KFL_002560070 [Klebsormidium nitens]
MGRVLHPTGLQLALLLPLIFSILVLFHTTSSRTPFCLLRKCTIETAKDSLRSSPRKVVTDGNSIRVFSDGRLSDGWFADLQDLRGTARKPAELGGWTEGKGFGTGFGTGFGNESADSSELSGFQLSGGARLWLKSNVAFATPRTIRIEALGTEAGSLELTLLTLDGGHEHSQNFNVSSVAGESGSMLLVADLQGAQFLLWQSVEVGNTGTGTLFLRSVQIAYPSSSELLKEQVGRIRAASPAFLSNRTVRVGGPSILVSLLSLAEESHFQRRLVPLISVLAPEVDLLVFVGNNTGEAQAAALAEKYGGLPLRWRNVSDAYPPRLKEFDSWQYVYENHVDDYEWFLHMDDDTFLNVANLRAFLQSVPTLVRNTFEPLYIGSPGFGATTHFHGRPLDLPVGRWAVPFPVFPFPVISFLRLAAMAQLTNVGD